MLTHLTSGSKARIASEVVAALIVVGTIDFSTGSTIRVVSLYFVPLALAGWRLGRVGAAASLLATLIWLAALYADGGEYRRPSVMLINFVTQGGAYLTLSLVFAFLGEAMRREQSLSRTDAMTGLRNRWAFVEQSAIAHALCKRYARPVALAYIDLDNFKKVNDAFGHARGDALLKQCGQAIAAGLRQTDIAARIGGDEFVIFLPETNAEKAEALCERLRQALSALREFRDANVTASIGVVVDDRATEGVERLLQQADAQMYRAKNDGKNRIEVHSLESARKQG